MSITRIISVSVASAFAAFGLSGCSGGVGPASEAPVALKPGQYAISLSGDGVMSLAMQKSGQGGPADSKVCLSADDDKAKINKLIRKQFALYDSCSHKPAERVGNLIGGKLTCKIDAAAGMNTDYKGSLTAESLAIRATMTSYAPAEGSADTTAGEKESLAVNVNLEANA